MRNECSLDSSDRWLKGPKNFPPGKLRIHNDAPSKSADVKSSKPAKSRNATKFSKPPGCQLQHYQKEPTSKQGEQEPHTYTHGYNWMLTILIFLLHRSADIILKLLNCVF